MDGLTKVLSRTIRTSGGRMCWSKPKPGPSGGPGFSFTGTRAEPQSCGATPQKRWLHPELGSQGATMSVSSLSHETLS
jgi:hypothetical protein